jgi:hypothetical protein
MKVRMMAGAACLLIGIGFGDAAWCAGEAAVDVIMPRDTSPEKLLAALSEISKKDDAEFDGFSAGRGREFFFRKHPMEVLGEISCASCHLKEPRRGILYHRTKVPCRECHLLDDAEHAYPKEAKKRIIKPFAPIANDARFTNLERVETWFKFNCMTVIKRECTAREKGDVLSWLLTLEKPDFEEDLEGDLSRLRE